MKRILSILLTLSLLLSMLPSAFGAAKATFKDTADTYGVYLAFQDADGFVSLTSYQVDKNGVSMISADLNVQEVAFVNSEVMEAKAKLSKDKTSFELNLTTDYKTVIKKTGKDAYEITTTIDGTKRGPLKTLRFKDVKTMTAAVKKDKKLADLFLRHKEVMMTSN